jgi:Big-like domain-containing protein
MVRMKQSLITLVVACGLIVLGAEAWAWQTNVSGTATGGVFNATALDGAGNVVAAGSITNTDTGNDFIVVKFDGASGAELWRYVISGAARTGGYSDVANAVAVDGAGNVVAAGVIWRECSSVHFNCGPMSDFLVVKLDGATGAELWRQNIENSIDDSDPSGVEDVANALAIDGAGDVVAAGALGYVSIVVKLDGANGAERWRRVMTRSGGRNPVRAVAVDGAGNVVVAGKASEGTSTGWDFAVEKFNGDTGASVWQQAIHGTHNDAYSNEEAFAVAIDNLGDVTAGGYTSNVDTGSDLTVVKFDGASGVEVWRQVISGAGDGTDWASAVAVDGTGNVAVAGAITTSTVPFRLSGWVVIKLDGVSGTELWRTVSGASDNTNAANDVAVDKTGDVVAAGFLRPGADPWFTVIKYAGASGTELWRRNVATNNPIGEGRAVAIDGAADVIVAGTAGTTNNAAVAAKLRGTDGGDFVPDTEPPTATMIAPANDAIVSGTITVSAEAFDNVGVVGVQFQLDGTPLGAEDTEAPYAVTWDTTTAGLGQHTLTAVARDAAGNCGTSAPVTVTVVNLPRIGILP